MRYLRGPMEATLGDVQAATAIRCRAHLSEPVGNENQTGSAQNDMMKFTHAVGHSAALRRETVTLLGLCPCVGIEASAPFHNYGDVFVKQQPNLTTKSQRA